MFNCFNFKVTKKNEKLPQEQPNASAESLLNSQIDAAIHSSVWWSMDYLSSKAVNDSCRRVSPANAADGSASPDQSNGHDSPQQSSLTRLDKLAVDSTKIWDEPSIKTHDYVNVPATLGSNLQIHSKSNRTHSRQQSSVTRADKLVAASTKPWGDQILEGHDYVNMTVTPGNSSQIHSKSNRTHSRQQSSVTRPDKLAVVSSNTLANQTIENLDYVVMQGNPKGTTPGDRCPLHPTSNDTHSSQTSSKMRLLDEVVADIEKWAKETDQCSASLPETYSVSKYRPPLLSSADKHPASQQSNTVTAINNELLQALQKQRKKIDVNDSDQKIASPLSQQIAAMEAHRSFSTGPFNIKPHHGGKTPWAVTVAGNRNQ